MRVLAAALLACWMICSEAALSAQSLSEIISTHSQVIAKSSRKTIQPAIDALVASKLPNVEFMLVQWRAKALWLNKSTNAIIAVQDKRMIDLDTQSDLGPFEKAGFKQIKPNSGVRNLISGALVAFQLNAPEIAVRKAALASIRRNEDPAYLPLLEQSLGLETDPVLVAEKQQLVHLLTLKYGQSAEARLAAIAAIGSSLDVEVRAALNPILATRRTYAAALPDDANIAKVLVPGQNGFSKQTAYQLLVAGGEAAAQPSLEQIKQALIDNIDGGRVAGKNKEIVEALELPPIKIHCSVLAEDSIKQAIEDYESKQ
jgi:urea transport system permease protein